MSIQRIIILVIVLLTVCSVHPAFPAQSTITQSEGYSCMGDDKSRKQTREDALIDAKNRALEYVVSYVKSETKVKNLTLESDMVRVYKRAKVKILEKEEPGWYRDEHSGDCFKVVIKAEIIPDEKALENIANESAAEDNPNMPLKVKLWTDKKEYKNTEKVKIYVKGNKPFYARVLYTDAGGAVVQLLPNPHRKDNYFNGGSIYEIPTGNDKFELEVIPPFGQEKIRVFASTSQLGDLHLEDLGGVYGVRTEAKDIGSRTRGIKIKWKSKDGNFLPSEFFERSVTIRTIN